MLVPGVQGQESKPIKKKTCFLLDQGQRYEAKEPTEVTCGKPLEPASQEEFVLKASFGFDMFQPSFDHIVLSHCFFVHFLFDWIFCWFFLPSLFPCWRGACTHFGLLCDWDDCGCTAPWPSIYCNEPSQSFQVWHIRMVRGYIGRNER